MYAFALAVSFSSIISEILKQIWPIFSYPLSPALLPGS